ncbi:MAG TPA: response regulator transcription factor [Gammaproteobacteria bacterium]|nr:response regulator transcription factor [Gammaproteobacteria bacterium]
MAAKQNILIIEDEESIRNGLIDVLIYHGFSTDFAADGKSGLKKALSGQFDLILLDVMLPEMDGFSVCEAIRQEDREQPIIMLTAKTSDEDIIQGLQLGADDYVAKPFSVAQLILRIQAVLRRSGLSKDTDHIIELGKSSSALQIDTQNLSTIVKDEEIHFTRREMDILLYLYNHAERPVPRDELLNKLWGYAKDLDLETRTVDIHIAKLRRKLEKNPAKPEHIMTIRGAGYRLMVD